MGMRYLEVEGLLGSHRFVSPLDMYEALMESNADILEGRERSVFLNRDTELYMDREEVSWFWWQESKGPYEKWIQKAKDFAVEIEEGIEASLVEESNLYKVDFGRLGKRSSRHRGI